MLRLTVASRRHRCTVTKGRNTVPPFGAVMPQPEVQDVAAYLVDELLPANAP